MCDGQVLFRSPVAFCFADCKQSSPGLISLPLSTLPVGLSCVGIPGTRISNISGSPMQSNAIQAAPSQLYTVTSGPPCRDTPDTYLASGAFLGPGGRFHSPFLGPLAPEQEPHLRSCQVLVLVGAGTWPLHSITFASAFLQGLRCSLIPSVKLCCLGSCPEVTSFYSVCGRTGLGSITPMMLLVSSRCMLFYVFVQCVPFPHR